MNKVLLLHIFSLLLISSVFSNKKSIRIFEVKAGKTAMKISVHGGRIISFKYCGNEILTQSSEHANFGSTLWTAPQSDWGWPPFAVLDSIEYLAEQKGDLLKMISQPDPISGFQIEKTWQPVGDHSIRIEYLIRNISTKPKAVGPWDVTRVPCGGIAFYPDGGKAKVPESNLKIDLQQEGINWISIDKNPIPDHKKLFSTAQEGWLGYGYNGMLFIKQFPDTKPGNYSPQQGEIEIYVDKGKNYTELENQGVYQSLKPGESLEYSETWTLMPIPENVKIEIGNPKLCAIVRKLMMSERNDNRN